MNRKAILVLIAAAATVWLPAAASGGIEGTHHDMTAWIGAAGGDACYACHGFKESGTAIPSLGTIGSMCYNRCHLGAAGVSGAIPLANYYPEIGAWDNTNNVLNIATYPRSTLAKYTEGHRMVIPAMPSPDPNSAASWGGTTGWPYLSGTSMECTTCHDVHSNQFAPFLRTPLSDNGLRANAFCHRCHNAVADGAARWADLYASPPNGAHPSEAGYGAGNPIAGAGTTRLGRTIVFKDQRNGGGAPQSVNDNGVFRNWSHSGASLNGNANHYNPGGKLGDFAGSGNVGCYTCHAVHLPASSGQPQLIVAPYTAGGTGYTNPMCVGCHGAGPGVNPGVTPYYHPVDGETRPIDVSNASASVYRVTTDAFNITVNMAGVLDNGANRRLTCMSCHGGGDGTIGTAHRGVHAGVSGTSVINPAKPNCASCHKTAAAQMGSQPNSHHAYGGNANYSALGYGNPSPGSGTIRYNSAQTVSLAAGMSCETCHLFNGTAHNWN